MHKVLLLSVLCLSALAVEAQNLPPVLKDNLVRTDSLTRVYLPPKRILYTQGNIKNQSVLLQAGNGQGQIDHTST